MIHLLCATVITLNLTSIWNNEDQKNLIRAQDRCTSLYEDAPCLKKFTKVDTLTYRAICNKGIEKKFACLKD